MREFPHLNIVFIQHSERLVVLCLVQGVFRMDTVLLGKVLLLNVVVVVVYNKRTVYFSPNFVNTDLADLRKIHVNDNILI